MSDVYVCTCIKCLSILPVPVTFSGHARTATASAQPSYASRQSREASPVGGGREKSSSSLSLSASCPARPARPAQTGLIPVLFYLWRSVADVMVCEISCALPILEAELRKARGGGGPGVNLWREQKIIIDGRNCDSKKSIHTQKSLRLSNSAAAPGAAPAQRRGGEERQSRRKEERRWRRTTRQPSRQRRRSLALRTFSFLSFLPSHITL